jgi:alpha-glucosidase
MHGLEGVGALASMAMDGGGVARVEVLGAKSGVPDVRRLVFRPTLDDGRTSASPSLALAREPEWVHVSSTPSDSPAVRFENDGSTVRAQVAFDANTSIYGGGLAAGSLLRNGRAIELWNTDAWRYGESTPALYQSHPYVLAIRGDGRAVGVLGASVRRGALLVATDGVEFQFERDPFDVIVIQAATPQLVASALSELTGRIEMPPLWALGYHQCRWGYTSADELRSIAREFRSRKIPCDALWLDIDYMDRHRAFTWDHARFPTPHALTDELRASGFRTVAILDPGLAVDAEYEPCASGLAGDHFVVDGAGQPVKGRVWPGICHFPDFLHGPTREWWSVLVARFVDGGVDGLWCDMNEPSVFRTPTKTLPADARHRSVAGGTHGELHNLYGEFMASATRDGLLRARPGQRPFVLTRSNFLGGSRYAATWTGDNQATWEDLRWSIPMVLSLGLCGQPFSGADIGGFDGDPSGELFARWFELGAYLPFARGHSEKSACRKEPWSFGPEIERHVRAALERRMQLLPTLYTLFHEACVTGSPIARPMFFADPSDANLRAIDDQFLLGEDLLVAPIVHEGASEREVVLPAVGGGWYRFDDGRELVNSGRVNVAAPLGTTPVFARAGSIVATKAPAAHTAAQADLAPILHVFLNSDQRAEGSLYEDGGENRGGPTRLTHFSARVEKGRALVTAESQGEFGHVARPWSIVTHGLRA